MNYYFRDLAPPIRNLFSAVDLEQILKEHNFPKELFRLKICSNPPCGILTHSLLGHEIGHALYQKARLDEKLLPLLSINEDELLKLIDTGITRLKQQSNATETTASRQLPLEESREFIRYALRAQCGAIAANWIREIFCDCVGAGLFGPAFVCSSAIFLLPFEDIDHPTEDYPPSRLRIQLALRALEWDDPGFGYRRNLTNESLEAFRQVILPWKQFVGKRTISPKDEMSNLVFLSVYRLADDIIREARQAVGKNSFRPNRFKIEVGPLRKRIQEGLPPNEYQLKQGSQFETASLQAILNAGWLSFTQDMRYLQTLLPKLSEYDVKKRFYGLISKAIEASEIQTRWREGQLRIKQ